MRNAPEQPRSMQGRERHGDLKVCVGGHKVAVQPSRQRLCELERAAEAVGAGQADAQAG